MGWEEGIMEETVRRLAGDHPNGENLKILNVGFGLGIVGINLVFSFPILVYSKNGVLITPFRSTAFSNPYLTPQHNMSLLSLTQTSFNTCARRGGTINRT